MADTLSARLRSLRRELFASIDATSLAVFRIAFGTIMLWEVVRYLEKGRVTRYYVQPEFFFTYGGFSWVRPWPGVGMYLHFVVLGALAILVALGLYYRAAAVLLFFGFTYVFLLDKAQYLNHFYLISLISFLVALTPLHRVWSLDAQRRGADQTGSAPAWALWILRAQLAIAYFYAGVAKLNYDWLVRGEPLRSWMANRSELPVVGSWLAVEWVVWLFVYGGLLLDLLIAPALLWRRTRVLGFIVATAFHVMNAVLFKIGIFPWFMIAATTLFFEPDWPRRVLRRLDRAGEPRRSKPSRSRDAAPSSPFAARASSPASSASPAILVVLGVYLAWQVLMPLRHLLYPGDVNWTEEGHRFSWRMKLRDKESSVMMFTVTDPQTGQTRDVSPRKVLNARQVAAMQGRPDMILQFARYLASKEEQATGARPKITARTRTSVNGRPEQALIDSTFDLASVKPSWKHSTWIVPLADASETRGSSKRGAR